MNSYPRETDDYQPFEVTLTKKDGSKTVVTPGDGTEIQACVVPDGARPAGWAAPVVIDGEYTVRVYSLTPGTYRVYARPQTNPGAPVINCGTFQIT